MPPPCFATFSLILTPPVTVSSALSSRKIPPPLPILAPPVISPGSLLVSVNISVPPLSIFMTYPSSTLFVAASPLLIVCPSKSILTFWPFETTSDSSSAPALIFSVSFIVTSESDFEALLISD